jgi:RNA polymerase sigma-B factor
VTATGASSTGDVDTFVAYRQTGDRALRNELVETHRDLAVHLARRYRNRGEPLDDLIQVAMVGLLKAVERFEPDRGVAFSTFAGPTIEGELKRHFRDTAWSVRVPRGLQELALEINRTVGDLSQQLGRSPTVAELARTSGRTTEEVLEALEASRALSATSFDETGGEDSGERETRSPAERLGEVDAGVASVERQMLVADLLENLPERERQILVLRFYEGMTQSQIASRVGISQMHVSRLIVRSLATLRRHVDVDDLLDPERTS